MNLKDRIFELVFPDRKKERGADGEGARRPRCRRRDRPRKGAEGYDPRYFIRHQR